MSSGSVWGCTTAQVHIGLSAYKPQREILFGTQLYKPMALISFCFQKRARAEGW